MLQDFVFAIAIGTIGSVCAIALFMQIIRCCCLHPTTIVYPTTIVTNDQQLHVDDVMIDMPGITVNVHIIDVKKEEDEERDDEEGDECPICMEVVKDAAYIDICKHTFCKQCITKWVMYKNTCPLCATIIV